MFRDNYLDFKSNQFTFASLTEPLTMNGDGHPQASGPSATSVAAARISHPDPPPSNRFTSLISSQKIATISEFELEDGTQMHDIQVAYKTWGKLNDKADNCMVICHALTGSADVEDWCVKA